MRYLYVLISMLCGNCVGMAWYQKILHDDNIPARLPITKVKLLLCML
jgi:hypothetical protein